MAVLRRGVAHYQGGTEDVAQQAPVPAAQGTSWFKPGPTPGTFVTNTGMAISPDSPAGRAANKLATGQLEDYEKDLIKRGAPIPGSLRDDGFNVHRLNPDYGSAGHAPLPANPNAPAPYGYVTHPIYDREGRAVTGDYLQPRSGPPASAHYDNAIAELKLNAQEQALYQRHLSNLWGPGGVDHPNGARSSLYQAVQPRDGRFYNIPTVWDGKIETEPWTHPTTGKVFDVPNATALQNVAKVGWDAFPSYATPDEADARYMAMHHYMERDTDDYFKQRNNAMAPQLKRGIAHYAEGDADTSAPPSAFENFRRGLGTAIGMRGRQAQVDLFNPPVPAPAPVVPTAPVPDPTPIVRLQDVKGGQDAVVGPAPEASPPGSIRNMLNQQYGTILADPNASALAQHLARSAQADVAAAKVAQTNERAQNLAVGPSPILQLVKGVFGNQADWEAIKNHDAAAKVFSDPVVQQHIKTFPNELEAAERDPFAYSKKVQLPEYVNYMKQLQGIQTAMQNDPKIHPDDHPEIRDKSATHNVPPEVVNATINPGKYARDEFARIMSKVPVATAAELFGPMFAHAMNPQESAMKKYLGGLQEDEDQAIAVRDKLATDPAAAQNPWWKLWGTPELELAKKRVEEARKKKREGFGRASRVLQPGVE